VLQSSKRRRQCTHVDLEKDEMTKTTKRVAALLASIAMLVAVTGCQKEGPAERAGKQVDKTVEDVKNAVKK